MKRLIYIVPLLILLHSCGNAFRVYHDHDPAAVFDQYRTYSFLDWTDGNKNTISEVELEKIRTAVARELEKKGLEFRPEGADLKVKITVYFRENMEYVPSAFYPNSYNYLERALAMDIFEADSKMHIWHSAAVGEVGETPQIREEKLPEQVAEMLKKYPKNKRI